MGAPESRKSSDGARKERNGIGVEGAGEGGRGGERAGRGVTRVQPRVLTGVRVQLGCSERASPRPAHVQSRNGFGCVQSGRAMVLHPESRRQQKEAYCRERLAMEPLERLPCRHSVLHSAELNLAHLLLSDEVHTKALWYCARRPAGSWMQAAKSISRVGGSRRHRSVALATGALRLHTVQRQGRCPRLLATREINS